METDEFYFYIEHEDGNCVVKLIHEFGWKLSLVSGEEPYELEYEFDVKNDADDILDYLTETYDYVMEIDEGEINDFI